jgi:hypothetical protein
MVLQLGDTAPDFEAVCSAELGEVAKLEPQLRKWSDDIEETQGARPHVPSVSDEEARAKFPAGWRAPKPYLRIVPQPKD